jgi:hypothetical protein
MLACFGVFSHCFLALQGGSLLRQDARHGLFHCREVGRYCREAYSLSHAFGVADLGGKKSKGEICGFSL